MTDQPTLTRHDLRTLRSASSLVIRLGRVGVDGPFEASLDVNDDRGCGARNARTTLPLGTPSVQSYELGRRKITGVDWLLSYLGSNDEAKTMLAFLRPGDTLSPLITVNNSTGNVKDAGLATDELRLVVTRTVRGRTVPYTFLLSVETMPTDACIRSVRVAPAPVEFGVAA